MPWQGHLWIGEPVQNYQQVRIALQRAGAASLPTLDDDLWEISIDIEDKLSGLPFMTPVGNLHAVSFIHEGESGAAFPSDDATSFALVGFPLTYRYSGTILDRDWKEGGRPDPFVINLDEVHQLLDAVHQFWPEARLMLMDNFF